jgi:hypothetical protein
MDLLGGVRAGDPTLPTINAKKCRRWAPWPHGGVRGSDPHLGSERCVVNLHRHDRQKVILLTSPILLTLSSVMADNP